MSFTRTATTDGFGRSVQITNGRFVATMMTGLLPVADLRIWLTTTSSQKTKAFFPHSGLMMLQAAQPGECQVIFRRFCS